MSVCRVYRWLCMFIWVILGRLEETLVISLMLFTLLFEGVSHWPGAGRIVDSLASPRVFPDSTSRVLQSQECVQPGDQTQLLSAQGVGQLSHLPDATSWCF